MLLTCLPAVAQEIPSAEPRAEHQWLKKFEGNWKTVSTPQMDDGQGPTIIGKIESKMLGKFWVVNSFATKLGETDMEARQTIGYDKAKKKYIATWVDNTSDFIWHCEGTLDASGKTLALLAEGPGMGEPGTTSMYRDTYEFISDDEIKLTSSIKGDDDKWVDFMLGTAKRIKQPPK